MQNNNNNTSSLREIFSEPTGKLSFTRLSAAILILTFLISYIYMMVKHHQIIDIPTNLALLITGLYGFNRLGSAAENYINNKNKPPFDSNNNN